jgi:hypothetical protein
MQSLEYEENLTAVEQDNTSEFEEDQSDDEDESSEDESSEDESSEDDSSSNVGGVQDSVGGDINVTNTVRDRVGREREPDSWESLYQMPNWIPDTNDCNASQSQTNVGSTSITNIIHVTDIIDSTSTTLLIITVSDVMTMTLHWPFWSHLCWI